MRNEGPYIDPNIEIEGHVPSYVQSVLDEMVKYSRNEEEILYFYDVDDLFVLLKNARVEGDLSKKAVEQIEDKYIAYAYKVTED